MQMVGVVLGADNTNDRFSAAASLLDYGFSNWKIVQPEMPVLPVLSVTNGMTDQITLRTGELSGVLVSVAGGEQVETEVLLPESLEAPITAGQQIGSVRVKRGEETVEELPIVAESGAEEITFSSAFQYLLGWFFGCGENSELRSA